MSLPRPIRLVGTKLIVNRSDFFREESANLEEERESQQQEPKRYTSERNIQTQWGADNYQETFSDSDDSSSAMELTRPGQEQSRISLGLQAGSNNIEPGSQVKQMRSGAKDSSGNYVNNERGSAFQLQYMPISTAAKTLKRFIATAIDPHRLTFDPCSGAVSINNFHLPGVTINALLDSMTRKSSYLPQEDQALEILQQDATSRIQSLLHPTKKNPGPQA